MNPLHLAAWAAALLMSSSLFAHTVALRLLLLLAGLGLVAVAIARDRRSLRLLPPLWIPLALWAAWSIASLAWSVEPDRSAKELRNEIGYSIATFWLCFVAAQARNAVRVVLSVVALAAALQCAIALHGYLTYDWFAYMLGVHGGPGNQSSAIVILLPCTVAAAWYGRRVRWSAWTQAAAAVLAVLLMVAAYITLNRTIWIALALQVALLVLFALRREASAAPRGSWIVLALASALVLGTGFMLQKITVERAITVSSGKLDTDPRIALWSKTLERIEEKPLTGYGFGRGLIRESLRAEFNKVELWHSHNLFLDTALQTGVPGLLLLVALFGATLRQGWRLARDADALSAACGVALIAVVLGTVVRNMTDVLWVRQNALLYWGAIGVLLAWGVRRAPGH